MLHGPVCLQCSPKCIAADVHDWASAIPSKAAEERNSNVHQSYFMVRAIAVVSIMV